MARAKPRRAPRTAPEVRREQLVAAAMPQFAALGYAGVQLQAIADQVGVTRNLIHHYFPGGKRDLYVEAVKLACADLAELLDVEPRCPARAEDARQYRDLRRRDPRAEPGLRPVLARGAQC